MGFFDWLKSKQRRYGGGSGETKEDAIIINAPNTPLGVAAEYRYLSHRYGQKDVDWTLVWQALLEDKENDQHYDLLRVKLKSGEVKELHFDITAFYGKF